MKRLPFFMALLLAGVGSAQVSRPANRVKNLTVVRSNQNPMIYSDSSKCLTMYEPGAEFYTNIDGPSVIKVPSWLQNPKAAYYMYFANHNKTHLRLAYANNLHGPWTVTAVHPLDQETMRSTNWTGHLASPDVHVDAAPQRLRMYFHGDRTDTTFQESGVATNSTDGLIFTPANTRLGNFYFRVWKYNGSYYAISKGYSKAVQDPPELSRSSDGVSPFVNRSAYLTEETMMRHSAVILKGDVLVVFFSRIGDAPERILVSTMDLNQNWDTWVLSPPIDVMRAEGTLEGGDLPAIPSVEGPDRGVNQLRDPCIYEEGGKTYLYYTFSGESGINLAEISYQLEGVQTATRPIRVGAPDPDIDNDIRIKTIPSRLAISADSKYVTVAIPSTGRLSLRQLDIQGRLLLTRTMWAGFAGTFKMKWEEFGAVPARGAFIVTIEQNGKTAGAWFRDNR